MSDRSPDAPEITGDADLGSDASSSFHLVPGAKTFFFVFRFLYLCIQGVSRGKSPQHSKHSQLSIIYLLSVKFCVQDASCAVTFFSKITFLTSQLLCKNLVSIRSYMQFCIDKYLRFICRVAQTLVF